MEYISSRVAEKQEPPKILESLLDTCLAPDTSTGYGCDNMTAMLILLNI